MRCRVPPPRASAGDSACTGPTLQPGVGTMGGFSAAGPVTTLTPGSGSGGCVSTSDELESASASGGGSGNSSGNRWLGKWQRNIRRWNNQRRNRRGSTSARGLSVNLSGAHLATGGGWQTLIELINPTGAPATAHLRIYDNNGNALAILLVGRRTGRSTYHGVRTDPQLPPQLRADPATSAVSARGPVEQGSGGSYVRRERSAAS